MTRIVVPISLPKELNLKIEQKVKKGYYASKSEYFRDLAREDLDRAELEAERKKYPEFYAKLDLELEAGSKAIERGEYSGPFTYKEAVRFLDSIDKKKKAKK